MTAPLAETLEQTIRAHRIMAIDAAWAGEIVFPYYQGLSIRNLAHTVVRLLDRRADTGRIGSSPLDARLWSHYRDDIRRVVLFLTDGLGWRLLQEIIAEDPATAQVVADLQGSGTLTPITSIAPSTTAAALPCIWTGAGPSATGMVGTELFLREFGTLASMLHFWPRSGRHRADVLEAWGLDFDTFLPPGTLADALRTQRIPTYLLLQKDLLGSGLSRLMHRGVKNAVRHVGYTDLWIELRELLRGTRRKHCFVNIYWNAVDSVSHLYGTVTEQSVTEVRRQLSDLRDALLTGGAGDERTLFMLAADHGHTPITDTIALPDHAPIVDAQRAGLGGEARFAHLYLRADYRATVAAYVRERMSDRLAVVDPAAALEAGLYSPDAPYRETGARLGDLTLIARDGVVVSERARPGNGPVSRHGGLSEREMLVPLLIRKM